MGNPAKFCVFGGSALLITLGGLMVAIWPTINEMILKEELSLSPGSIAFNMWRQSPVPILLDVYLFNWTNPHEAKDPNKKPTFTEMGPYVFSEHHERVNVTWTNDSLVQFHQIRRWKFEPELSNGSLSDNNTNLNAIAASAVYSMRFSSSTLFMIDKMFDILGTELTVTKPVRELLFEGYQDPVLDMIHTINSTNIPNIPFDRFGWFYMRNNSWKYDGLFEMHTGTDDLYQLGELTRWNNVTSTKFYHSYCGMVNGTTGELWPPLNHTNNITLFATDLCRSLRLDYAGQRSKMNIPGNFYTGGDHLLDNGEIYPDNKCFCGSEHEESCLPTGVTNVSLCRYGAPAFVSYPHFYLADPFYRDKVDMPPASDDDIFTMLLEPRTGIPLDVDVKLQINLLMQPYRTVSIFRGVKEAFLPMIWFRQRAELTPKLGSRLKLLLSLPTIGPAVFYTVIGVGVILFCVGVYMGVWGRWSKKRQMPLDEGSLISEDEGEEDNSNPAPQPSD